MSVRGGKRLGALDRHRDTVKRQRSLARLGAATFLRLVPAQHEVDVILDTAGVLGGRSVIDEDEAVKNADSANNVRLKLKLHRDNPANARPAPAAAAPVAAPVAPPKAVSAGDWGLELKLEDIEEELPPEDPGRQGI